MLLTPIGVSCSGFFADAFFGTREYETDVLLRMLLLDKQMLLPISGQKSAFALNDEFSAGCAILFGDYEIRSVTSDLCRFEILNDLILVFKRHPCFQ